MDRSSLLVLIGNPHRLHCPLLCHPAAAMVMASALALLLTPRPVSARPTSPLLHSRRLTLPPPRSTTISAPAATHPRKVGHLQQLNVTASCCNNSAPAAGTSGASTAGAKDWRFFLAWYLMSLDKNPIATKAVTSVVLTLAGDHICQVPLQHLAHSLMQCSMDFLVTFRQPSTTMLLFVLSLYCYTVLLPAFDRV